MGYEADKSPIWHKDFPADVKVDMLDMIAKAMMIRSGGDAAFSPAELRAAAETNAEIAMEPDGTILFRTVRQ